MEHANAQKKTQNHTIYKHTSRAYNYCTMSSRQPKVPTERTDEKNTKKGCVVYANIMMLGNVLYPQSRACVAWQGRCFWWAVGGLESGSATMHDDDVCRRAIRTLLWVAYILMNLPAIHFNQTGAQYTANKTEHTYNINTNTTREKKRRRAYSPRAVLTSRMHN